MTLVDGVGWVLLHFVWQGAAVALALLVALALVPPTRATVRYALSATALLLMLLAPAATAARLAASPPAPIVPAFVPTPAAIVGDARPGVASAIDRHGPDPGALAGARTGADLTGAALPDARPAAAAARRGVARAFPWVVAVWAAGVLLLSVRLAGGWWRTRRLRRDGVADAPDACRRAAARLAARLGITRAIGVLASARVAVPVVCGHLKPVVLLPVSALSGLSAAQLEAVLAHELAHVRRHDYLVNLAQSVIETLLFYHPGVWWVSRQVRLAREHCCDDLAVAVCGDRRGYVEALLRLEHLRQPALLALGAADGPLLARARRLLLDPAPHAVAPSARLAASAGALIVAGVAVSGASGAFDGAPQPDAPRAAASLARAAHAAIPAGAGTRLELRDPQADAAPPAPVLTAPEPDGPLAARWTWAEREARQRGHTRYWIGYAIAPAASIPAIVYLDRTTQIVGDRMSFSGHFVSSGAGAPLAGLRFPGRPLDIREGPGIKLLFAFAADGGAPALTRVHGSTHGLPVDLSGLPVFWLGAADAASSLARVDTLYGAAASDELRQDLVAAGGVHGDSPAVVAWLDGLVRGNGPDRIRAEAVEWLAWHPVPAALAAIERAARSDRAPLVRREAAEAMGDLAMPEAGAALIGLARTLADAEARREAVEALGSRPELAARDALAAIAREDANGDIQREAVETLGDYEDQRGVAALLDIVRSHPSTGVRREAVETLADAMPAADAVPLLKQIALEDADDDVAREAVEALADLEDGSGLALLMEFARTHPRGEVRREAVEALAQGAHPPHDGGAENAGQRAEVIALLDRLAREDRDDGVRAEAVETLGDIPDEAALARLRALAESHADAHVRREAIETLVERHTPSEALALLRDTIERDADQAVRRDAVERLADVPGAGARAALEQIARTHADADLRAQAVETLGDLEPAQDVRDILKTIAGKDADARVRMEALETLADLPGGAGVAALIELARAHPDTELRRRALEALVESDHPQARELFERALQKPAKP